MIQRLGMWEGIAEWKNFLRTILTVDCYLLFMNLITQKGKHAVIYIYTKLKKNLNSTLPFILRQDIVPNFFLAWVEHGHQFLIKEEDDLHSPCTLG